DHPRQGHAFLVELDRSLRHVNQIVQVVHQVGHLIDLPARDVEHGHAMLLVTARLQHAADRGERMPALVPAHGAELPPAPRPSAPVRPPSPGPRPSLRSPPGGLRPRSRATAPARPPLRPRAAAENGDRANPAMTPSSRSSTLRGYPAKATIPSCRAHSGSAM